MMNPPYRLAAAVVAVLALGIAIFVARPTPPVGPARSEPPTQTPGPTAVVVRPGPSGYDQVHISELYGYGIRYPSTWKLTAGTIMNEPDYVPELAEGRSDFFGDPTSGHGLMVTAGPLRTGESRAAFSSFVPGKFINLYGRADCQRSTRTLVLDGEPADEKDFYCPQQTALWVATVHAGTAYQIVWLDDGPFTAAELRPMFDRFLESFTFTR